MGFSARLQDRRHDSESHPRGREALLAFVPQFELSAYALAGVRITTRVVCVTPCVPSVGLRAAVCACVPGLTFPFLPAVLNTLRHLSTTTSILTDPSQLPEQAAEAVTRIGKRSGES